MPPRFSKHGRFFPHQRSFVTGGYVIGAYGAPLYYDSTLGDSVVYDTAAYAPPPVYSAPPVYVPVVTHAVPAAPARPSVIEFPEGRYELRGDGMAIPYSWVWIPNPPVAPPAAHVTDSIRLRRSVAHAPGPALSLGRRAGRDAPHGQRRHRAGGVPQASQAVGAARSIYRLLVNSPPLCPCWLYSGFCGAVSWDGLSLS